MDDMGTGPKMEGSQVYSSGPRVFRGFNVHVAQAPHPTLFGFKVFYLRMEDVADLIPFFFLLNSSSKPLTRTAASFFQAPAFVRVQGLVLLHLAGRERPHLYLVFCDLQPSLPLLLLILKFHTDFLCSDVILFTRGVC